MVGEATRVWVENNTIGQVLRSTTRRWGDRDAAVFVHEQFRLTYSEFDRQVDQVAKGLMGLGLQVGDHMGIWATNWSKWVLLQFATARIGVVLVNINPSYRKAELEYALRQADVKVLALIEKFKSSHYFDMAADYVGALTDRSGGSRRATLPRLQQVIALSGTPPTGMLDWNELLELGERISDAALHHREAELKPTDPINIQFTSGTTGTPKGAVLTHRNMLLNTYYCGLNQAIDERDRICVPVPLYHCFGCVLGTLCAAVWGAAVIFPAEYFDPELTLQAIEAEKCTSIYGVPTMFITMLEHATYPQRNLRSLRTGIMAGSPCPIELMKRVTTEMGAREITIGYGQTEASPLITQTQTHDPIEMRVGTVGRAFPDVEVKIVDVETKETLPLGQQGELCARGHNIMLGYYNMPELTAEAIDQDGWLHTGDLAVQRDDGYYRITGRLKDMIIRGGENIYPREIEDCLYLHPDVAEVHVLGVPDTKYGEQVLAWVKLREDSKVSADDLRQFCRETLARFKTPTYIKFVQSFPMTVTGKVQKFMIRQQAIDELGLRDIANQETA